MSAREAEAHGLVSSVVPAEATVPAALELAARVAAMPPLAVIAAKEADPARTTSCRWRPASSSSVEPSICSSQPRTRRRAWQPSLRNERPLARALTAGSNGGRGMEREPQGGSDYGLDLRRDMGDEPPGDDPRYGAGPAGPDRCVLAGERSRAGPRVSGPVAETPEHDWAAASRIIYPALRPVGTQGLAGRRDRSRGPRRGGQPEPLPAAHRRGPVRHARRLRPQCRLVRRHRQRRPSPVVGRAAAEVQDAAMGNLASWSAARCMDRRGVRRATPALVRHGRWLGRRPDPAARKSSTTSAASSDRSAGFSSALPERHLLIAGTLRPGDDEFAALFADFIVEHSGGADEPIDRRVFELVDGRLVEFAGRARADGLMSRPSRRDRRRDRDAHARSA